LETKVPEISNPGSRLPANNRRCDRRAATEPAPHLSVVFLQCWFKKRHPHQYKLSGVQKLIIRMPITSRNHTAVKKFQRFFILFRIVQL
jgi:hypothetical protein